MSILENPITFDVITKTLPLEGNLVYEYNAFRNYRLNEPKFLYNNILYSEEELIELGILIKTNNEGYDYTFSNLPISERPEFYEEGELIDFDTSELSFDLNHPVQILPLYSYDGSVNLILNDGKNIPRLINSRFSPIGRNKYKIIDRAGSVDTNIYDEGSLFDIDTSLYKRTIEIPTLIFDYVKYGGNLTIGNYHFYFKYLDADGNETDFILESGLVSIFIGNTPNSIRSGFRDENSHKMIKFTIKDVDSAYLYINVYYSKVTGDVNENEIKKAYKINDKFLVRLDSVCLIIITGFEDVTEIPIEDLNILYEICGSVETQATAQNMLFLANISKPEINYKELLDLSLRFVPFIDSSDYLLSINQNYIIDSNTEGYYDPKFIYNQVGYWNNDIYRFGIVYILSDNSLSPVFNVRGKQDISSNATYTKFDFYNKKNPNVRNYITYLEDSFEIISQASNEENKIILENVKGVCSIKLPNNLKNIIGINFKILNKEVLEYLQNKLKIKGFFFVRQKRIPTTLCQAFMIGIDPESNTPVLPISNVYITESFIDKENRTLNNDDIEKRIYELPEGRVRKLAAICPDYDVNSQYYNSLFTGTNFVLQLSSSQHLTKDNLTSRHYHSVEDSNQKDLSCSVKILGVEDNTKLVEIDGNKFSARAGEAEEAFRYEYIEYKNKISQATNILRGSYGPYLAITGAEELTGLVDIKIPGYSESDMPNYFKIRYNDKSSYYAISERISLSKFNYIFKENSTDKSYQLAKPLYRGDCYICQFTHRLNRNFQDPSAPTNDLIVDPNCWKDNYEIKDGVLNKEKFDNINLGDVNAVQLGLWVTFTVRSNYNLNIRAIDESIPDEIALTGHGRGFFPYYGINESGNYKTPEALCYNKGFGSGLSERWNFEMPDVPAIKNDFTNRILYSDTHITDAFLNGFRVFKGLHYKDYPKTYGQITKIVEWFGNLMVVFEHGVGLIPINERTVAGQGDGGSVFINTSNVLPENPKILSDTFGSLWKESVIKTPKYIYGVDTIGKKIWRTNGLNFECISDMHILEFLNNNISLTERELTPIIGVRNVKTHYNEFKQDVMFTFYDNLYGFEEKVWNICWNESLNKWITFYSWVPSYSENIYNLYFSFDRNTSKWIAKLGISKTNSDFADGITLSKNIFNKDDKCIGELSLSNRNIPLGDNIFYEVEYFLERDNYQNYKNFKIVYKIKDKIYNTLKEAKENLFENEKIIPYLYRTKDYFEYCSELFVRGERNNDGTWLENTIIEHPEDSDTWQLQVSGNTNYYIVTDDRGRRIGLSEENKINANKIVILLNIKAKITIKYENGEIPTLKEAISLGFANGVAVDGTQYESVVAVIPKYNMQFLTTDFWKHGQAGIIDISDKIYPTYWYGKQHPFEFEFVVADNPDKHKIFDNLLIISNKAEPESFHYEIVGECYDFAKDKKNMYIRLEATKELYQYNGSDIVFDRNYSLLSSEHRPIRERYGKPDSFDRSTIFPLYYCRLDTINEIEDYYHLYNYKNEYTSSDKNHSALAGAEIVRYENLDEYRIWNHAKAVNIKDLEKGGRMRGNMLYKEDVWDVQINPINFVLKNESESDWENKYRLDNKVTYNLVPAELNLFKDEITIPSDRSPGLELLELPENWTRNIVSWKEYEKLNKEVKLKDKFMKVRIRYSGKDLAIISAVKTLYSISYA